MIAALALRYWSHAALAFALLAAWHFHSRLLAVHAEFDTFVAQTERASKEVTARQIAAVRLPAILSKAIAEKSNAQAPSYYADVRAAAERMRKDSPRCPRVADLPRADHAAPVDDGPGVGTKLVSITVDEYQHYTDNTARLAKVRQDALALISSGAATGFVDAAR